ncbi:MarR family transcriptional regulator [Turicibacter sanguinis]|nr:MarR family transcriptional regulator [Turicibacter sanguinis]MTP48355.1 MarR family transcriptional regulator [Turicibacter sanguinis]MTP50439.1 MarR family transcriptional regulator [Turicibacter sanguinis]MTQ06750.1 MarR family transcriptional regulator [Turicibacter sanguinis]
MLANLNLIDLISEKHAKLRKLVRDEWANKGEEYISDTESYMLALLEREKMTVSQLARQIDMSRQGAHKCARGLLERGYIEVSEGDGNSRDKVLMLTKKGQAFCKQTLLVKEQLEDEIKEAIGVERFEVLKEIMSKKWMQ